MRAIVVEEPGGPEVLEIGEVQTPTPGPGEILITVLGAGVNRADLLQRQGHYAPPPGSSDTIGLEVSGHVAELGDGVTGWAVGDACVALLTGGGYAAYVVAPAGQVVPPPPGLDLLAAAGVLEVAATVYSNLELARLSHGEVFLVHGGAGGIGSFAIQYAKAVGATVITTAGGSAKLDYCRALGADHAISYRGDWPRAVRAAAGDRGVDVILDNMGAKYLGDHLRLMAPNARLVVIGMQGGTKAELDFSQLMSKRAWVTSTSLRFRPVQEKAEICRGVVEKVWPLLADGTIQPTQHVTYPLAEAAQAHARLESGDHLGKIILAVSS
jgi:putative PIG3 family NAD(P)H quinone oxidoreductase